MKKTVFEGYTTKDIHPCWTIFDNINLAAVIQKTKNQAYCRYDNCDGYKSIIKVRLTIEQINENKTVIKRRRKKQ